MKLNTVEKIKAWAKTRGVNVERAGKGYEAWAKSDTIAVSKNLGELRDDVEDLATK